MATMRTIPLNPEVPLETVLHQAEQLLQQQGYLTQVQIMNESMATLNVLKDRDGLKNIIGLGVEVHANISVVNNVMQISIENEWTNKIVAIAVGWFCCLIPFITGIVGCVNQNELGTKVANNLQLAATGAN